MFCGIAGQRTFGRRSSGRSRTSKSDSRLEAPGNPAARSSDAPPLASAVLRQLGDMEALLAVLLVLMIPGLLTYLVPGRHQDETAKRVNHSPRA
jgi:hypothetical protein